MKFGKRLASEASRKLGGPEVYFDYKKIKAAIKQDVEQQDAQGSRFQTLLVAELQKVSSYYTSKAEHLETTLKECMKGQRSAEELAELRSEVQELIKYVALNYLAVVKAIKKRNRHLQENFGTVADTSLHALDLLIGEVFFTSPRLAELATQAEVLSQVKADSYSSQQDACQQASQQLSDEYSCPVCLDVLHNPVVLTCAHRFCWGCLVAHSTASRETLPMMKDKAREERGGPTSYRVLEQIASMQEPEAPTFYPCPVCRKPQIMDIDTLQVDTYLEQFINNLQDISNVRISQAAQSKSLSITRTSSSTSSAINSSACNNHLVHSDLQLQPSSHAAAAVQDAQPVVASAPVSVSPEPWGIIPPQPPQHQGKLCVLLDLDGTLVSSFTPKRAPRLPAYMRSHIVGVGSKLNPYGVFVVERPGLPQFLEQLALFAEVIVFTAGLEEYAKPIIDAIDPSGRLFAGRIYRDGTLRTEHYQCVKDMARLNRDLGRTVLVDDTPLAFLHQPENGIPVLGFRGDPDDGLLLEAVLPLLKGLARESDVRTVLRQRFNMSGWFKKHGFPVELITHQALQAAALEREHHMGCTSALTSAASLAPASPGGASGAKAPTCLLPTPVPVGAPSKQMLLIMDFDKTLTDCDAGERVVEQLAPELLPMLIGLDHTNSFIPITNSILSEISRRGVSRDRLLSTLQQLGAEELPPSSIQLLRDAQGAFVDVRVLSDCNSVFISHMLAGAGVAGLVTNVTTNTASFEWSTSDAPDASRPAQLSRQPSVGQKLVIQPLQGAPASKVSHSCSMCPCNMCKGMEVRQLQREGMYESIVYAGDGANDICPALCLGPKDVVLARAGYPLAQYIARSQAQEPGTLPLRASCHLWTTHDELRALVRSLLPAFQPGNGRRWNGR